MLINFIAAAFAAAIIVTNVNADDTQDSSLVEIARKTNESLLWGPYRPNLYYGIKPRIPKSLLTGLMWTRVDDYTSLQDRFRHTCEQTEDIRGYGWDEFDIRTGGVQNIYDEGNRVDITTNFVKIPGGSHGGSWATRIRGKIRKGHPQESRTTIVFYASMDGLGSLEVANKPDVKGFEDDVTLIGNSPGLGDYKLIVTKGSGNHPKPEHEAYFSQPLDRTFVCSAEVPEPEIWQTKATLFKGLKEHIDKYVEKYGQQNPPPPAQIYTVLHNPGNGNLHLIQKVFEGDFEFDVLFQSGSLGLPTSSDLSNLIQKTSEDYWKKFMTIFAPQPPFTSETMRKFSSNMFSNLIGGLGYFYGDSVVDRSYAPEYDEENEGFWEETAAARARKQEKLEGPSELFTTVPSRSFFPRGFLWDEGFHLIPIVDWDLDLALEIVKSWFNLMDDDGWIGREQILGAEARSKVPPEFQVQYPHYANPPTLFFIIDAVVAKLRALSENTLSENEKEILKSNSVHLRNSRLAIDYLQELYPKLHKHYKWYRKTQAGDTISYDRTAFSKEAYRWRGRSEQHILTSGLDDYPRPQPPHPGELHIDLLAWMGMMTKSLKNLASFLDFQDDVNELSRIDSAILRNIDDLHWSEEHKCYCDASIDLYEENILVCHKGYISLFPFLTGLVDAKSEKLSHLLNLLENQEELWSNFGIRSLSKKSEFYGIGENYWRGPIWLNINYLITSQLLKYAQIPGPNRERCTTLYSQLRLNLVRTVYDEWIETGFAWEQYNSETGKGQRTQHFTGWTSLVVKLMAMPDLGGEALASDNYEEKHDEL
ncbi:putative mannosyl-oligosaccharide glucosidase [Podosphaera aphanis]|nr:putative mannosyl-oligosaccharide glucosidase [Podosphaera aphanis]